MALRINPQSFSLPDDLAGAVKEILADWSNNKKVKRLWESDVSLWTGADESNWLGWLTIVEDRVVDHCIAITDPGSKLRHVAEQDRFCKIFLGVPTIGGRYSALSDFGLAPATAMGINVPLFLERTQEMVAACGADFPAGENPGAVLGAILGAGHNEGRTKVTIIASEGVHDLGAWLEQLLAESTGKNGKGLIPVDGEALGSRDVYGDDRVFVYLRLESASDPLQDAAIVALRQAGQPVV